MKYNVTLTEKEYKKYKSLEKWEDKIKISETGHKLIGFFAGIFIAFLIVFVLTSFSLIGKCP